MLDIQSEPIEPRQMRLAVTVPPARLQKTIDEVSQAAAARVRIPGYRPGKVPARLLEQYLDLDKVRAEAIDRLKDRLGREAILQADLKPGGPVTVEVAEGDPPVFTYLVPLTPEVDLGDYHALRVPFPEPEPVPEAAVDERIERWLQTYAYLAPLDRPSEAGDVMQLSLHGRMDGDEVYADDDLTLTLTPDAAVEAALPGEIVDHLLGLRSGESHSFDVAYSEFWPHLALRGRTAVFTAEVLGLHREELPVLDDDFVQNTIGTATVEDLRQAVRGGLADEAMKESFRRYRVDALAALVHQAKVEYAPVTLDLETVNLVLAYRREVEAQGLTWQRFLELENKSEQDLLNDIEPAARHRLEQRLVLEAFAMAEQVTATKAEVEAFMQAAREEATRDRRLSKRELVDLRQRVANALFTEHAYARLTQIALGGEEAARARFGDAAMAAPPSVDEILEGEDDDASATGGEVRLTESADKGVLTITDEA